MPHRPERLAEVIKKEVSEILRTMKDPRIGFVSVTTVEVSTDLRYAKIYVSVFGDEAQQEDTWRALQRAQGFVRTELGRRIRLRHTPEVTFVLDRSIDEGARLIRLIDDLRKGQPGRQDA